jgi:hypothetical protein
VTERTGGFTRWLCTEPRTGFLAGADSNQDGVIIGTIVLQPSAAKVVDLVQFGTPTAHLLMGCGPDQ